MPRRPCKLQRECRLFHVTARAVNREHLFRDDHDRRRFVVYLEDTSELWGWRPIAWCLMGTHHHLVVAASFEQMSHAVHRLHTRYAMYVNRRYDRRGHLFENRFHSWAIRDERHLMNTITYVLNNPVRAGLCVEAADWPWSRPRPVREPPLPVAA
jgi:REP-associated tyrosine transposase